MGRKYRDADWLHQQYVENNRTLADIAEELDVHVSTVSKWRQRHNIEKPSQQVQLECPVCGAGFERYQNRVDRAKHVNVCSRECLYEGRREGLLDWSNRIINGDARSMDELSEGVVDLIVTSPPYNVDKEYDAYDDDKSVSGYREFLRDSLAECARVLRDDGGRLFLVIAGFGQGDDHVPANKLAMEVATSVGFNLRRELIWQKSVSAGRSAVFGSFQSASSPAFFVNHESLLVFYLDEFGRSEDGTDTIGKEDFLAATDSVWEIPSASGTRVGHPSPFPIELARRAIELLSYEGDVVLDPFVGSGTTAVAAQQTGRCYVGYDISSEYCELARNRVDAET